MLIVTDCMRCCLTVTAVVLALSLSAAVSVRADASTPCNPTTQLGGCPPASAGSSTGKANDYSGCTNVIVGAGWSGMYYAWRTTLVPSADAGRILSSPASTCVFEAQHRVGGRAYSYAHIPGLEGGLRIDLGAYRFDTHAHVLVNQIVRNALRLPVRCYDTTACNGYGNLTNVKGVANNNGGYAAGPEGLAALLQAAGVRIFLNHRLTGVYDSDSGDLTKPLRLKFAVGAGLTVDAARVFLNLPNTAIRVLDPASILFTKASADTKFVMELPAAEPGAKQFLIYPTTKWRTVPALSNGLFGTPNLVPPQNGRYHDFYGKCQTGDCAGAILSYYDFVNSETEYFSRFQKSSADPGTFIALAGNTNQTETDMIRAAHTHLMSAMRATLSANNITTFDVSSIPEPTGTLIGVWWARDFDSAINPGPNFVGFVNGSRVVADPTHRIRNRISKPLNGVELYIGNEAFSTGEGWAQPALVMTERVLYHFLNHKPNFVVDGNDCLTSYGPATYGDANSCLDRVTTRWYETLITPDPPNPLPFSDQPPDTVPTTAPTEFDGCAKYPNGGSSIGSGDEVAAPCKPLANLNNCPASLRAPNLNVSWHWIDDTQIEFVYQMRASGWVGFGFGASMSSADLIVAYAPPIAGGVPVVQQRFSQAHMQPSLNAAAAYATNLSAQVTADGVFVVKFTRTAAVPDKAKGLGVAVSPAAATPFIYASSNEPVTVGSSDSGSDVVLRQHTFSMSDTIDLYCGYESRLVFETDIKPLFRAKDRNAMLFQFDLWSFASLNASGELTGIIRQIADKTKYGLATGMPPDITWSVNQLRKLQRWYATGAASNTPTPPPVPPPVPPFPPPPVPPSRPTYCADIKALFRASDQSAMTFMFDLWQYADVKTHATAILASVTGGSMPCDSAGRWTPAMLKTFNDWMSAGLPEGDPAACTGAAPPAKAKSGWFF